MATTQIEQTHSNLQLVCLVVICDRLGDIEVKLPTVSLIRSKRTIRKRGVVQAWVPQSQRLQVGPKDSSSNRAWCTVGEKSQSNGSDIVGRRGAQVKIHKEEPVEIGAAVVTGVICKGKAGVISRIGRHGRVR